jgi:hypothetical protein
VPAPFASNGPTAPVAYEDGRWFVIEHRGCDDVIAAQVSRARSIVVASPATPRALSGLGRDFCAKFVHLTLAAGRATTTWAMTPTAAHSHSEGEGVIVFGPPIRG